METQNNCENCSLRAKYDLKPKSFAGRFWRWHINFCPGWKKYFHSLADDKKEMLIQKYKLRKG
jgi:hypothetical protein